ncbi:pectinesterase 1-like [Chenopodium quinoa]|uniref:pectinesterase 1-like n=1 Tax=Chenopodium quinoa TaxID=63459 RepID=UPI000B7903D6|nr:pectinesterase 1-like [Chenopodium quinoa]
MGRKLCIDLAIFLINILTINAQTLIPANDAEVNKWFQESVKRISIQKGTFDPNVVEAESGGVETIDVRQDGSGKFKTISDAVKHVKVGNTKRVIITIGPGEYKEKVKVDSFKSYVTFYGTDPKNRPTITFSGTAAEYGTVDSATLIVESDYFVATNIIISNAAPRPDGKRKGAQAAAMRISGDKAAFYNCKFVGYQDTLCDDKGNHFFKDCYIEGTVDFIFGEARSLYLNTEIHVQSEDPAAVITAHARNSADGEGGYSFVHCNVTGTGSHALLGRAWMEAARVVYSYCTFSDVVNPEGWSDNSKPEFQKTVFFGEYNNKGPGASLAKRVPYTKKLTDVEAKTFISLDYIEAPKWLLPPPRL